MDWTLDRVYGMTYLIFFHVCDGLGSIGLMKTLASFKKFIEVHLNRSKILLLHFYEVYDINLQENFFGRCKAY